MTEKEGIILSAYTGVLFVDFPLFHKYAEEIMGRPILTHEFASEKLIKEIKKKSEKDFLNIRVE